MPFNRDWLIPDDMERKPAWVWLGALKALWYEGVQVIQQIEKATLEEGTPLTAAQRTNLENWFDGWLTRLQNRVSTPPS